MKKRNKSYMLYIYGVWISETELVRDIRDILLPVVDSGYLKFVHGIGSGIICFKSVETFDDINDYIKGQMPDYITNYIFTPKPRKLGHNFKDGMDTHLFDLDTDTNHIVKKQNDIDMTNDLLSDEELFPDMSDLLGKIDGMFEEFVSGVKNITKSKELDLDEILDKITENGLSSLTEEEKEFLNKQN